MASPPIQIYIQQQKINMLQFEEKKRMILYGDINMSTKKIRTVKSMEGKINGSKIEPVCDEKFDIHPCCMLC